MSLKVVPFLAILMRNILKLFPLSFCQYVSTIPEKKNCMLPAFEKSTFLRVCTEKMMDYQYRENGTRTIYSNYYQMRAYAECSPNQSTKLYVIDLSIEKSTKL